MIGALNNAAVLPDNKI